MGEIIGRINLSFIVLSSYNNISRRKDAKIHDAIVDRSSRFYFQRRMEKEKGRAELNEFLILKRLITSNSTKGHGRITWTLMSTRRFLSVYSK